MALPPDLEVQAMDAADLDPVIELIGRCDRTYLEWAPAGWEPPDLGWYRKRWQRRLRNRNHWARGAFDRERRLRAVVAWLPDADRTGRVQPGVAHVSALFVDPTRWREGIATALIEIALPAMRERGNQAVRLWTPEGSPAERFYESAGWRREGRRDFFEELGLNVVGYRRSL